MRPQVNFEFWNRTGLPQLRQSAVADNQTLVAVKGGGIMSRTMAPAYYTRIIEEGVAAFLKNAEEA